MSFSIFSVFNRSRECIISPVFQQIANFSKYISKSRAKRLPLTTKRAGKGYYKGNRTRKEGYITDKARFISLKEMHTELVVPDLKDFKLKPYVGVGAVKNQIGVKVEVASS